MARHVIQIRGQNMSKIYCEMEPKIKKIFPYAFSMLRQLLCILFVAEYLSY